MENKDNKTTVLRSVNLLEFKDLIEKQPMNIATVSGDGSPNLCIASDKLVLSKDTLLISNNEMIHTPDNIALNEKIMLSVFDEEWSGLRLTGTATYHSDGKYFSLCKENFENETTAPKGAILVKVFGVEKF